MEKYNSNILSLEDYESNLGRTGLKFYSVQLVDVKKYLKELLPQKIDKSSVRANLLTVQQYSNLIPLSLEKECRIIEDKISEKSFYSLVRNSLNK